MLTWILDTGNNPVVWYAPVRALWLSLEDVRRARGPDQPILLLGNHLLHLWRQVLQLWSLHDIEVAQHETMSYPGQYYGNIYLLINLHIRGAFFAFVLKILSEGIIFRWKCGTCTWSRSRSRRSPSTSTCAPSCAASMRTTASSTSSRWRSLLWFLGLPIVFRSAAGMGPTLRSWLAATTISSGGCWTWRSSFHLGSRPKISVWMPSKSD